MANTNNITGTLPAAQAYYNSPVQGYFPGSTVAGTTALQRQGYQGDINASRNYIPAAQEHADRIGNYRDFIDSTGGVDQRTINAVNDVGASFDPFNNPALNDAIAAMRSSARRDYDQTIAPYAGQAANAAGQRGSSREAIQRALTESNLNKTLAEQEAQMRSSGFAQGMSNYINDRANTMNAANQYGDDLRNTYGIANQAQAGVTNAEYALARDQRNYGSAQQAINNARLAEEKMRYDYTRDEPYNRLGQYNQLIGSGGGGGTNTTSYTSGGGGYGSGQLGQSMGNAVANGVTGLWNNYQDNGGWASGTGQNAAGWGTTPGSQQTQMLNNQLSF